MTFKKFSIDENIYEERNGQLYMEGSPVPVKINVGFYFKRFKDGVNFCHIIP
jgi:hypothetical protein